jgi:hypothetical protein
MRVAMAALLVLPAATALALDEAMDIEVAAVLKRVKSPDAAKRTQAVNELVGLRMSVSDALKAVVADASAGVLKDPAKMSAIVLMGGMGLADCAQVAASCEGHRRERKGNRVGGESGGASDGGGSERDRGRFQVICEGFAYGNTALRPIESAIRKAPAYLGRVLRGIRRGPMLKRTPAGSRCDNHITGRRWVSTRRVALERSGR